MYENVKKGILIVADENNVSQSEIEKIQKEAQNSIFPVIFATETLAYGINSSVDVSFIDNYGKSELTLPKSAVDFFLLYNQESGEVFIENLLNSCEGRLNCQKIKWGMEKEDYVETVVMLQHPIVIYAKVVPIALDKYAYKISDKVQAYNFIREYELDSCKKQQLFISMVHEIYRYGFNEKKEPISKNSALKIFLSHAKDGKNGLHIAKQLKRLIDDSTLTRFFDSNDIAPGYRFDDEIINNIKESSVIIINSDIYSSRYWCQREIQTAKELERPIIEVDLIDEAMDRKFPFAGNVPVIRVNAIEGKVEEEDLYRILENIMLESIRFNYADEKLELLKLKMPGNVKKMCRPPEMIDVSKIIRKNSNKIELKYNKIIYPDPPIYSEEIEFFQKLGIEICTPIEYEKNGLSGKKVGISISDPEINEIKSNGQNESHLLRLSQYMANYILGRGATLIYGGDFRKGGYTEQLLQEAQILKDRLKTKNIYLKNYVAWPIYLADTLETKKWIAKYCDLLEIKEIPIDETVSDLIETNKRFLTPDTVDNCYVWSKSLTKMRYEMIKDCNARICAGGKKIGYKGKMPGILEEIIIASELGC